MSSLREQIFELMKAALGEPEISRVQSGELYRWTLKRPYDLNVYITMDSPEYPHLAHIMVSDSTNYQEKPVVSTIVYSIEQAEELIQRILDQWKLRENAPPPEVQDIGG